MTHVAPWERLPREALDAMAPHHPALADEIIATIRREVSAYALPLEGAFGVGVRRGVEQALAQFNAMAANPGVGRSVGRNVYVALGRAEWREGRSLDALLAAYRIGARVAWRRLAEVGVAAGFTPDVLIGLAEAIFAYIDELSAESAEGYAREQADQAGELDRRRAVAVELLVREPPPTEDALAAAAESAAWVIPRELAVIAWPVERGRRPLTRLPLGSIAAPFGSAMCAVVADPDAPGRRAELEHALAGTRAGVGSTVPAAEAARSFARATAALALAQERGDESVVVAAEHRAALLCRADPGLVAETAADRLSPLEHETLLSRARLAATLLAWLRSDGNVPAAAGELGVHAQTVRYRLARLRELYGETLDDPDARFELEVALRASPGV